MARGIEELIVDRLSGEKLIEEEEKEFEKWYSQAENREYYYQQQRLQAAVYANRAASQADAQKAWKQFRRQHRPRLQLRRLMKYAALLLLPLCGGLAFYLTGQQPTIQVAESLTEQVVPGKKQALLILSNGRQVALGDSLFPPDIREEGALIRQSGSDLLRYETTTKDLPLTYHTLQVPRGGEYRLVLADGSCVWINSDSRLTYPVTFTGAAREVEVEGEAYFEVVKNSAQPFIVHTGDFDIRVTGTQFNVRTYPEEAGNATLAEGGIQLQRNGENYLLQPGQQASVGPDGQVLIRKVDMEEALAWRHEVFCFRERRLEPLLEELARWYDLSIFYQHPEAKDLHFTAWFRRNSNIREVVEILEKTGKIKLQLNGKTLIVQTRSE